MSMRSRWIVSVEKVFGVVILFIVCCLKCWCWSGVFVVIWSNL